MQLKILLNPSIRAKLAVLHFVIAALYMWFAASYQLTNKEFSAATPDFFAYFTASQMAADHISPYHQEIFKEKQSAIIERQTNITSPGKIQAFINPPQTALLFLPFSQFTYLHAFNIWLVCNLIFSLLLARDIFKYLEGFGKRDRIFATSLALGIFPWGAALIEGQVSILLSWTLLRFFIELKKGNLFKAALWSAVFSLKPHFFVLMLIPLAIFGYWRLLGWCACVAVGIVALTTLYFGVAIWGDYVHFLQQIMSAGETYGASTHAMMNVRGVTTLLFGNTPIYLCIALYLFAAVILAWLSWKYGRLASDARPILLMLAVILAACFGPWLHGHDVYLFVPCALILLCSSNGANRTPVILLYVLVLIATLFQPAQQILSLAVQGVMIGWAMRLLHKKEEPKNG